MKFIYRKVLISTLEAKSSGFYNFLFNDHMGEWMRAIMMVFWGYCLRGVNKGLKSKIEKRRLKKRINFRLIKICRNGL
jgi:hypothetical protein